MDRPTLKSVSIAQAVLSTLLMKRKKELKLGIPGDLVVGELVTIVVVGVNTIQINYGKF